eukprot:3173509-Pyramimonas_sp.AAC.1
MSSRAQSLLELHGSCFKTVPDCQIDSIAIGVRIRIANSSVNLDAQAYSASFAAHVASARS